MQFALQAHQVRHGRGERVCGAGVMEDQGIEGRVQNAVGPERGQEIGIDFVEGSGSGRRQRPAAVEALALTAQMWPGAADR